MSESRTEHQAGPPATRVRARGQGRGRLIDALCLLLIVSGVAMWGYAAVSPLGGADPSQAPFGPDLGEVAAAWGRWYAAGGLTILVGLLGLVLRRFTWRPRPRRDV